MSLPHTQGQFSSGTGMYGGKTRCYPHYMDWMRCLSEEEKRGKSPRCQANLYHYLECLHGGVQTMDGIFIRHALGLDALKAQHAPNSH